MFRWIARGILAISLSSPALAQSDPNAPVKKVVAYCVNVVHTTKLGADQAYMSSFYRNFDAFYNPASSRVENSARLQGDEKPLYIFNKCMSEQGFPLTSEPQQSTTAPQAAVCNDDELVQRNGDCWIKLSVSEKRIVETALGGGELAGYDSVERQLYSREAMNPAHFLYTSNVSAGFDALYAVPEYRTIGFADALDLVLRQQRFPTNPDIGFLREMYRNHRKPMLSGHIQKFVPPNKVVIAEWNDSTEGKLLSQQYGNPTQTVTILGIASTPANLALTNFMNALLNIKSCHTLITQADAFSHMKKPLPDATQKGMRNWYSSELDVVLSYPTQTYDDVGPQFFNAKGELSADILLDATDQVCDKPNDLFGVMPVTIGNLLFGEASNSDFEPILATSTHRFISLNSFLLANGLQPTEDTTTDPRPGAQYSFGIRPKPTPDAVEMVLKVGAAN